MSLVDEATKWAYPDVKYLIEDNLNTAGYINQQLIYEDKINDLNSKIELQSKENDVLKHKIAELNKQIELLEISQLQMLDGISKSIEKISISLKKDSFTLIKTLVQKIILREMRTDPELIKNIIDNSFNNITADSNIEIQLSDLDFKLLAKSDLTTSLKMSVNNNLGQGDIFIILDNNSFIFKLDNLIANSLGT